MNVFKDRRGAVAAMSAVVMVVVLGFAGLAIDLTRIWMVNARLKTAIDAAALVAARQISLPAAQRDAQAQAIYWANFTQNGRSLNYLGSNLQNAEIVPIDTRRIRVNGQADVSTTLFSIISARTTQINDSAVAERQGTGLELAVVLDQTSSMGAQVSGSSETKLEAAQAATRTLLGILYGSQDTQRNLFVSVVPFARTINVGSGNSAFLDTTGLSDDPDWNIGNWNGCVEARRNGNADISDLGPDDPNGLLRPYYDRSTYRRVGWANVSGAPSNAVVQLARNATTWETATGGDAYNGYNACTSGNAYTSVNVSMYATATANSRSNYTLAFCRGDNDWTNPNGLRTSSSGGNGHRYNPEYAYLRQNPYNFGDVGNATDSAAGPNRLCAETAMLPLTASRATIEARVNAITAPTRSAGTTVVTGMQGAWYVLSPRWQGMWPGSASSADLGTLPLAYNTRNMVKAVIMLTDGDNNWQAAYASGVRSSASGTELLYNAYGRVADWNAAFPGNQISPVNQDNADARLDARFAAICTAMKNAGIRVYMIGFEIANNTHRELLKNCATTREAPYYLEAPSAAELNAQFTIIANQLASLRLAQ